MLLLQLFAILMALLALLAAVHLNWAWFRLRTHPHVESVEIAKPVIANELKNMVSQVSIIANISPPPLFIRRGRLANAFVVAAIFRPELYITDELLEHCSGLENGLDELTRVICHEIAHIQRGDAIKLGLLTYGIQWSHKLSLKGIERTFQTAINEIEHETDEQADLIFQQHNYSELKRMWK